jgi:hypothetical protein
MPQVFCAQNQDQESKLSLSQHSKNQKNSNRDPHHDIELLWPGDELHAAVVDDDLIVLDCWKDKTRRR